ncbi:hypothetical protein SB6415_02913 [Klebsiella pasteurii]|nr:hypothetical protein SB6415_02913 [Klebsiella pasteurii]
MRLMMANSAKRLKPLSWEKQITLVAAFTKKRLNKNRDRAIILAKGAEHWFYTFLYAKQDIANIDNRELAAFRELARHYSLLSEEKEKMAALVKRKELVEICHDCKN